MESLQIYKIMYLSMEQNIGYIKGNDLSQMKKTEYDTAAIFNWNRDVDDMFWEDILEDYSKKEKPRIFASEVLHILKDKGFKLYIITARCSMKEEDIKEKKIENILKKWLNENNIPYDELCFSGGDKREAMSKYNIDIMIEDSPKNIEQLKDMVDIIVFDAMYNKNSAGNNIIRVNSWYEILYYLENVYNKGI